MTDSEQGGAQGQTSQSKDGHSITHTHSLFSAQCPQGDLEIHFLCFVHTQIVTPFSGCALLCVQSLQRKKTHYDDQTSLRPLTVCQGGCVFTHTGLSVFRVFTGFFKSRA